MSIILFQFEDNKIRFVGTADNPEWIAADVCKALEIANVSDALDTLEDDEKGIAKTDDGSLTGSQMLTVTEAGLYRLIFKSRKPAAKRMKKWVLSEVLPSIRRTGSYSIAQQPTKPQRQLAPQRDLIDYIEALSLAGVLDSPILKSLITQRAAEQLGGTATQSNPHVIATVRAHDLGYSQKQIGNGSSLGSFIKKQGCKPTGKTYHGTYNVNTYELTPEFDDAIHRYFS